VGSIRWLGHSGFEIALANKILLIDPWLTGNPRASMKASDIKKSDVVCVTHDHGDHLGDAVEICKRTGATFVGIYELGVFAEEQGVKDVVGINIGGTVNVKGITISLVQAFHSSTRGVPTGFVIKAEGKTIYHTGDTGLFGDMKLIGEVYRPDVALVPIGNHYTMGPEEAAKAVKLIRPDVVIPIHYQTFPFLKPSAADFTKLVKEKTPEIKVVALKIGEVSQL
jgi:L-ascorbate metabolism protein UlaG (beta-lactamase superfamily)